MKKIETEKLLNKIKGYYNSQFFIDEYVIDAWYESLKPYEFEDAEKHLQEYLKNYPEVPPRPHIFKNGLYTPEEKERMKNTNYTIQCNLCGRWMDLTTYDRHYDRCLDIQYLVSIAKQKGEELTREDLENCKAGVIEKLLEKYPPKEMSFESLKEFIGNNESNNLFR
jgi:hypothetical protein